MTSSHQFKYPMAAASIALALTLGVACNDRYDTTEDPGMRPEAGVFEPTAEPEGQPITVTGCLQEEEGLFGNYILTVSDAMQPGAPDAPGAPGAPPTATPEVDGLQAYRLSEGDQDLEPFVGQEVRVSGRLEDVPDRDWADRDRAAEPGMAPDRPADHPAADLQARDLASIEVESVMQVAEVCGAPAGQTPTQ